MELNDDNVKEKGVDIEEYGENKEITKYDESLAVKCNNGIFVGLKDGDVISYKGIPYAEPPIKNLRFKPPIKKANSDKAYEAYYLGKTCFQTEADSEMASMYKQGEDCLTLNVWRNISKTSDKKPVMVFIHGGAFGWGGTADPLYEGTNLIKKFKDIILVTLNYRVNILGFINLSILEGGEEYPESGNLGLLDQICALEWIHENIKYFGGDPNNVTIFGESAGGTSVTLLPLIKSSKGLFNRVIAQSGSYQVTLSKESSLLVTKQIIDITKATKVEDLINLSEDEIKDLIYQVIENDYIFPIRDGIILPEDLYNEYDRVDFSGLDFIIGTNKDEYRYWIDEYGGIDVYEYEINEMIKEFYNEFNEKDKIDFNNYYKTLKDEEIWNVTEAINSYIFHIPAIMQAEKIYKNGGNVFMYYWTFPRLKENFGACHAVELSTIFNNLKNNIFTDGNINYELSENVQQMWINFAIRGNPSNGNYKWSPYDLNDRKTMILGEQIHEESDPNKDRRIFLSSLGKYYMA